MKGEGLSGKRQSLSVTRTMQEAFLADGGGLGQFPGVAIRKDGIRDEK